MGKVKELAMAREAEFMTKAKELVQQHKTWNSFTSEMENHMTLVEHMDLNDVIDNLNDLWTIEEGKVNE